MVAFMMSLIKKIFSKKQKNNVIPFVGQFGTPANPDYEKLWETCIVDEDKAWKVASICARIMENQKKYLFIQEKTNVPWQLIAALHSREASLNFNGVLHNGEKIIGTGKKTTKVPKGRGPFATWEDSAVDAILLDKLTGFAKSMDDWAGWLKAAERFNGFGYRKTGEYSPYVWAATNHSDETGKYVADGKFDRNAVEKQIGVAAILIGLGCKLHHQSA